MKVLKFIKDYWYIPLIILVFVLGWIFFRKWGTPIELTKRELEAIEAGRRIKELELQAGTEAARNQVERDYAAELEALDKKQQVKAASLRRDPQALAKFLVRAGR